MDKEFIKKLAENPNFIPGIYNYCDRWCERCPFTFRCMNFAMTEEHFADPQTNDINNKMFWEKLSEMFKVTLEMVKETAAEQGIDLDSLNFQQAAEEHKAVRNTAENHECSHAAKTYGKMVTEWFESSKNMFKEKADEMGLQVRLELPGYDPSEEVASLKDSVDIIRWYQHFIYVKITRALQGNLQESSFDFGQSPKDSDGSAKIALIAIDRSIAAWGQMREHFPELRDNILDILVHLDRLRRKTEKEFPKARAFVRPGFDSAHNLSSPGLTETI